MKYLNMFLPLKESLRLSIYSIRRCDGFSNCRYFHLTGPLYLRKVSYGRRKESNVKEYESNPSVAGEFSVVAAPNKINDNFFGIESDEGVIEINNKPSLNNSERRQLFQSVEKEKLITTTFGTVRYDSENKPKYHGQLEKEKIIITSSVEKNKIYELSQTLCKSSVNSHNVLSRIKKNSETIIDVSDRNLESKLPSNSYVDELYFPESYTKAENNNASTLESSPTSSNEDTINIFEESYFNSKNTTGPIFINADSTSENISSNKNHPPSIHEKSAKYIANHKSSSYQEVSGLKSSPSCFINDKSNFIEEFYSSGKVADETIIKNVSMISKNVDKTDENNSCLVHMESPESITDDKQSSFLDDYYFNTISVGDLKIDKMNLDSASNIVHMIEKKSNEENSTILPAVENNKLSERNVFIKEPEVCMTDFQVNSRIETFNNEDLFDAQEIEDSKKKLYNLNDSTEDSKAGDNNEKLSLQWNNPSIKELESYNKFLPDAGHLTKKKNNFLFGTKVFLKESELINRKTSRLKKLTVQRNLDETVERIQNEEEVAENPEETSDIKVKKVENVQNSHTNEQLEMAHDFVKKLRNAKKKLDPELINGKFVQKNEQYDSKGFRILKRQVPDLKHYTRDEILELLAKNVLYSDDDLIVLNKPYNLVMHESKTAKDPCLSQYLDDVAAELDKKAYKPKLITVHRLDKETSGCLLLARNEISAQRFLSLFSERKIVKTYWIVTIKVPDPLEGVIDMPISEGSVNGRARMVLHPDLPKDIQYHNHSKSGKRAVTQYKVIAESGNAALVEANPETGIKHQIRVHFGFGLSCPILGDHKYSHLDKLAPQKLQSDLLQRLQVRQSKVRHIPMHIYARSIFIPQYRDGRNLFVMAPMPIHMSKNLQKLKFRKN